MKRTFRKYPSSYIQASTKVATNAFGEKFYGYDQFIYYKENKFVDHHYATVEYKYGIGILHEDAPKHNRMPGMLYWVEEISIDGEPFRPITKKEKDDMGGKDTLDYYRYDNWVGYVPYDSTRLRPFGHLEGDQVVKK